jgi:hypothetical protein
MAEEASAISRDIDRRTSETFRRWADDCMELYHMADLTYDQAVEHVTYVTLSGFMSAMVARGSDRATIHRVVDIMYDMVSTHRDKRTQETKRKRGGQCEP